jgi:hypothetical protein
MHFPVHKQYLVGEKLQKSPYSLSLQNLAVFQILGRKSKYSAIKTTGTLIVIKEIEVFNYRGLILLSGLVDDVSPPRDIE